MKTTLKIILIGIITTFILSSCTVKKRLYMPGYHVESVIGRKHNKAKSTKEVTNTQQTTFAEAEQSNSERNKPVTAQHKTKIAHENALAFETKPIKSEQKENTHSKLKTRVEKPESPFLKTNHFDDFTEKMFTFNSGPQSISKQHINKENTNISDDGNSALKVIGWVLIILGILILLVASILVGILLMLLGLVFVVSA
ncbi:MAG: hypothetical protein PF448_06630 [Bacteroidales bacterium]|jgi:hypothetical protein|nr:hypothetical protein [Bacteroidales bacterium]